MKLKELEPNECPYCKNIGSGVVGDTIYFHCGGDKGSYYSCDVCNAEWKELTEVIIVERVRLK